MYVMDDVLDLADSFGEMLEKSKRGAKRVLRGEGGFSTLVTVLVILALGAIIITPLLVFVVTGQKAGRTHNEVTDRLYAADTGIQDGVWRIQNDDLPSWMLGTWGSSVYDQSYTYMLPTQVNDKDVSVTLRGIWLLEGLESAKNGKMPHAQLVTVGNVSGAGTYKIVIMDNDMPGNWGVERIGIWLPAGFTYTAGSSNLEKLDPSDDAYMVPTVSDWKGGHTIVWDYAAVMNYCDYTDLPAETPTRRVITFSYTPGGPMANAFSWTRTNSNDVYLSWSGDVKLFSLEATATNPDTGHSTTVIAANMLNTGVASGMAVNGDYAATGNALIRDQVNNYTGASTPDGVLRERLYKATPGELSGIPDTGTARKIMLYWTGWKGYPFNVWPTGVTSQDVSTWTETQRQTLLNLVPNYKMDKVSLQVKIAGVGEWMVAQSLQADSWQVVPGTQNPNTDYGRTHPNEYPNGWYYSCYADVTDLVKTYLSGVLTETQFADFNGEATYTVGHAQGSTSVVSDYVLQGIWGSSASDVYVVGDSGTIVHYNGISWNTVAVGATGQSLKGVWGSSSSDVWAVGNRRSGGGGNYYYTVLHSTDNGTTWEDLGVTRSSTYSNGQSLRGVWGSSGNDVWSVGDSYRVSGTDYFTILRIQDGGASLTKTTAVSGKTAATLYGIWGVPSQDVYAVGASGTILHYNYSTPGWVGMSPPTGYASTTIRSVWGLDQSQIWAVGDGGAILYNNGSGWSAMATRPSYYADVTLFGVWGTGGVPGTDGHRVYVVGYRDSSGSGDDRGVIWYNDGGNEWHEMNSGSNHQLYGAWGSAQDNIYVAGESTTSAGCILHYDGVDDNGDGSLWDPVTGGTQMYSWTANHSGESPIASTDYPLGDPAINTGDYPNYSASHAAWSVLVIYTSPETKGHQLYIYDTLRASGRYTPSSFKIEGFLAPSSVLTEDDAAKITCFVGEGDNNLTDDNLYYSRDPSALGSRLNNGASGTALAANNVWNSISNAMAADGIDIDTFAITGGSGTIQPGDSEAKITFETGADVWNMVYMILSLRSDLSGTGLLSYIVK